ncbi:MAG: ABC transporter substrate-binding protein [Planctomycetota bacterium]|jgi:multiple sugar transport system substrate-binding protein
MRRSHLILFLLVAATLACVIPHRAAPSSKATVQFTVWGMPFEDRLFEDVYARGFEALHPGVVIDYGRYDDPADKYFAWHMLGKGADVMRVRITDYHTFVARGMLQELDPFINDPTLGLSEQEQADFMPAIWSLLEVDGRRYALPSDNAQYGLYYNKALFDRYNADHPEHPIGYPDAEWTWQELRDAAGKLTLRDTDGNYVQYGIDFALWSWPFMGFLRQAGGELWDEEQTTTLINSSQGVEALQLIVDLIPHSASMRSVGQIGSASGPDKLFAGGHTAMLFDGSWRAPDLERVDPDLDFAIAPLPRHRRRAVMSGSVLWAISAHSEHKEVAWRMIKWMTSHEQSLQYWDALRVAPPARLSVTRSDAFQQTSGLADRDGTIWVHPMPRDRFDSRAAWMLYAVTPDLATGEMPGFVPVGPYQMDLEDSIEAMLKRAVSPGRTETLQALLNQAAGAVHGIIDRDRRARGLAPVHR